MIITEEELSALRRAVAPYLSPARYRHTLGVAKSAAYLASSFFSKEAVRELCAAALLHDIAKELPQEEQKRLMQEGDEPLDEEDLSTPALYHAFAAPALIKRDFPRFATEDILSSVFYHTTGRAGMTLFEKIVFLSDYIEEGRTYPSCVKVRSDLAHALAEGVSPREALDRAVLSALEYTLSSLTERSLAVNSRTVAARDALLTEAAGKRTDRQDQSKERYGDTECQP